MDEHEISPASIHARLLAIRGFAELYGPRVPSKEGSWIHYCLSPARTICPARSGKA